MTTRDELRVAAEKLVPVLKDAWVTLNECDNDESAGRTGDRVSALIRAFEPNPIIALLDELEAAERVVGWLRSLVDENDPIHDPVHCEYEHGGCSSCSDVKDSREALATYDATKETNDE